MLFILAATLKAQVSCIDFNTHRSDIVFSVSGQPGFFHYNKKNKSLKKYTLQNENTKKLSLIAADEYIAALTDQQRLFIYNPKQNQQNFYVNGITGFELNDSLMFASNTQGEILIYHSRDFNLIKKLKVSDRSVNCFALSKKKTQLIAVIGDGRILLIDWNKNKLLNHATEPLGSIQSLAYNESEDKLIASYKCGVHFYDGNLKKLKLENYMSSLNSNVRSYRENIFFANALTNRITSGTLIVNINSKYKSVDETWDDRMIEVKKDEMVYASQKGDTCIFDFCKNELPENYKSGQWIGNDYIIDDLSKLETILVLIPSAELRNPEAKEVKAKETIVFDVSVKSSYQKFVIQPASKTSPVEILPQFGFAAPLKEMLFSADGKYIVTVAESPIVKIWDNRTQMLVKEIMLPGFSVMKATIHPSLPLVVIWDRNFELHLIDLDKLALFKTLNYTHHKYRFTGDYDSEVDGNYEMKFNESGNMLSIYDKSLGEPFSYDEYYDKQLSILTEDLYAGKLNKIKADSETYQRIMECIVSDEIYEKHYDTTWVSILYKNSYSIMQSADSSYFWFNERTGNKEDLPLKDSMYFLDENLTVPLEIKKGSLPGSVYYKSEKPGVNVYHTYIYKKSKYGKYLLVKNFPTQRYFLVDKDSRKVIYNTESNSGVFIEGNNTLTLFYDKDVLINLNDSARYDLTPAMSLLFNSAVDNGYSLEPENFSIVISHEMNKAFIWWRKFDHSYLEFDFAERTLYIRTIKKPLLGQVRPSIDNAQTHLGYKTFFSRLDFTNLSTQDYFIQQSNGENHFLSTSSGPYDCTVTFNLFQSAFTTSYEEQNIYSVGNYLEVMVKAGNGWKRYLGNSDRMTLDRNKCRSYGEECEVYDCAVVCDNPVNMDDTLAKINFHRQRLNASEREKYSEAYEASRNYDKDGVGRIHGRGGEHAYLFEYYKINFESNSIRLWERKDFDSLYISDIDVKYSPRIYHAITGKLMKKFNAPEVGSFFHNFISGQNKLATYAYDGSIRVYDISGTSSDPVVTYYRDKDNYIFITPDNYYKTTSRAFNLIKFRKGDKVYGIEQFDLKYNRPDILLQRMGSKDSLLIKSYYNAYLKRLKKMGFTEQMLNGEIDLPEIKIQNFEMLPEVVNSPSIQLHLDIKDKTFKLDRINIYINDVALYGLSGIDLRNELSKTVKKSIPLELATGLNKIQVSVLNQAGAESYKETVYITYKPKQESKPDLYLITVGDSKYKDERYNLTYASKDADDIANTFKANQSYKNVFTYGYTNEKVTKENILKLKEELKKAKRDDVVIITVAGHGVLDKDLNYYLATYDMDFNNPGEKGIPYEELESLVDGIAPLKKIIFLDACHSGEVDKEEVEQLAMNTQSTAGIKFRSAGAGIQKKNLGLKTTSELMSELFTDLRRGTGATVISSAGGAEYAMESDQWQNGLFTYCMLHGLKDKAADANGDGQIMLSELQQYLRTEVTRLSNGAQQPTSRIENLSLDFVVW